MATWSCSLRVAACRDAMHVTQHGATACPSPAACPPTLHHPARPTLTVCLLPGLLRAPAGGQQQPGGGLSTAGKGAAVGSALGPLKHLCLTSEWSMSTAGAGGMDVPGDSHGSHPCSLSPGAGTCSPAYRGPLPVMGGAGGPSYQAERGSAPPGRAAGRMSLSPGEQGEGRAEPAPGSGKVLPAPELPRGPCPGWGRSLPASLLPFPGWCCWAGV